MKTIVYYGNGVQTRFEVPGSASKAVRVGGVATTAFTSDHQSVTLTTPPGVMVPVQIDWDEDGVPPERAPTRTLAAEYLGGKLGGDRHFASRVQVFERQGQVTTGNFPINTWDATIYRPTVLRGADGTYRMYYAGYDANYLAYRVCYATSTDLITWTKPNLGLYTYGGNTANNIVLQVSGVNMQFTGAMINPLNGKYIISVRNDTSGQNLLYDSTNGTTFTFVTGALFNGTTGLINGGASIHPDGHVEGCAPTWSERHGKWRWWYRQGGPNVRSLGFYDASTLAGPWTNRGVHPDFRCRDWTQQYYDMSTFSHDGRLWAVVNMYDVTQELLATLRCYVSEDGGDSWVRSTDLLRRSVSGAWDNGLVTDGTPILKDNVWHLFYGGKTGNHVQVTPITLGLATARID